MDWQNLLQSEIQDFIKTHHDADIRELALKKAPDASWPYALILDQIKVRQKAKIKSPDLYETDGFIFPNSDVFEQASSSPCANYKASMVGGGDVFYDLTAGVGVDGFAFARCFNSAVFVERDQKSAGILSHNSKCLGLEIAVLNQDAENAVSDIENADLVFIDPQRRDSGRKGFFAFEDCSPNILEFLPILSRKTKNLIIKASPLLDIEKGIETLKHVAQVHVVQWNKECKELLFVLDFERPQTSPEIIAVDLNDNGSVHKRFAFNLQDEKALDVECAMPEQYLYEPDPAFQKAGGYKSLAAEFDLKKLHPNTHLYTSDKNNDDFPGRVLKINNIVSVSRKALQIENADLAVRNFPLSVQDLRKKLKLSDGGNMRVYAVTLMDQTKKLIICDKLK